MQLGLLGIEAAGEFLAREAESINRDAVFTGAEIGERKPPVRVGALGTVTGVLDRFAPEFTVQRHHGFRDRNAVFVADPAGQIMITAIDDQVQFLVVFSVEPES